METEILMGKLRRALKILINYVTFWRGDKVPGVGDQIRRTQLRQDQKARKKEMEELILMVREGRLHEADERQLETLNLMVELQKVLGSKTSPAESVTIDPAFLEQVKLAVAEVVATMPAAAGGPSTDPSRPKMHHTSLADLVQSGEKVDISHSEDLGEEKTGAEDSKGQLEKLRSLKGK
jgi:hypothetical protein